MTQKANMPQLFESLHKSVSAQLQIARASIGHAPSKGVASEGHWLKLLENLPERYKATSAFVIDSEGNQSEQIDIVVYDRQYTPIIFQLGGAHFIPAEGVYAVFEVKQEATKEYIEYAGKKIASVRALYRTSLPVPHIDGVSKPKDLQHIIGGFLCLESSWSPPIGDPLFSALQQASDKEKIDIVCVSNHGIIEVMPDQKIISKQTDKAVTFFLFRLITLLQSKATVPMIDLMAYAKWL